LNIYSLLFRLILRRIPAETAHHIAALTVGTAGRVPALRALLRRGLRATDPTLHVDALGMSFPTPLGVAAGMDKDATWFEGLAALGFGFVEVGTITAERQPGNSKPRVFRLVKDRALLNSMGFPNPGAQKAAERLGRRSCDDIVGVNVGKSRRAALDEAGVDYRASVRRLAPFADFIVLNVSSPNTPGLRELQSVEHLRLLLADVQAELASIGLARPVLVKIGPDLSNDELDGVADLALAHGLAGIVAVNTTLAREGLTSDPEVWSRSGGISGAPLKARSLSVLRRLYARVGNRVTLISVGGVETSDDAWQRILAGATLVQGYAGFVYGGPLWPKRVNDELASRVRASGFRTIQELVGAEGRHEQAPSPQDAELTPS
jgi:dihydroorotate dehydrogenase